MTITNKILVIGAGIAGPTICYWFKRFGFQPTLIEKFPSLRKGGHAVDIRGAAIEVSKKMGIYEKICSLRTSVKFGRYVDAAGNILHEEKGEEFAFRQGDDVEIKRGDLVKILLDTIEGIPCRFNQSIDNIQQNDEAVVVKFHDGRSEHYDLVIGADGLHSKTRSMVFHKDEYNLVNLGAYFSVFSIPNYLNLSHAEVQCESNQKLISITSDKDANIAEAAFCFRPENHLNNIRDKNKQQQILRDVFQNFGWESSKLLELMPSSDDFYFDSISQVKMSSWTKGRVALVGDAGYCASPQSGQGSNMALVGAYILAGELKEAKGNYIEAFKNYNKLLHPFIEVNQKLGALVNESFLVNDEVSKDEAEERSNKIMEEVKIASNMISLKEYEL